MQNDFCHPDGYYARSGRDIAGLRAPIAGIGALLAAARGHGAMVGYTRIVRRPEEGQVETRRRLPPKRWFSQGDRLMEGSWGAAVIDELTPRAGEVVIDKKGYSAFHGTGLGDVLVAGGIRTVVLSGVVTYACVLATAFDAFDRGFDVVLASDGSGSWIEHLGACSEEIVDLLLGHAVPVEGIRFGEGGFAGGSVIDRELSLKKL